MAGEKNCSRSFKIIKNIKVIINIKIIITYNIKTKCYHGRFFPTHVTLQSHEDTRAYANVYKYVKENLGQPPKKWMADGAKEITAAGEQVNKSF